MDDGDFQKKIEVSLARIEERQIAAKDDLASMRENVKTQFEQVKNDAKHQHNNLKMELEKYKRDLEDFVPRTEVEAMHREVRTYAERQAEEAKQHCDANRAVVVARVEVISDKVDRFGAIGSKVFWAIVSLAGTSLLGLITWFITFVLAGKTL